MSSPQRALRRRNERMQAKGSVPPKLAALRVKETAAAAVGGSLDGKQVQLIDGKDVALAVICYNDGYADVKALNVGHRQAAEWLRTMATVLDGRADDEDAKAVSS